MHFLNHNFIEKSHTKLPGPVWRSNCHLNLITGFAIFGSKNRNQVFAVADNESFTSPWRNLGPQNCFNTAT